MDQGLGKNDQGDQNTTIRFISEKNSTGLENIRNRIMKFKKKEI